MINAQPRSDRRTAAFASHSFRRLAMPPMSSGMENEPESVVRLQKEVLGVEVAKGSQVVEWPARHQESEGHHDQGSELASAFFILPASEVQKEHQSEHQRNDERHEGIDHRCKLGVSEAEASRHQCPQGLKGHVSDPAGAHGGITGGHGGDPAEIAQSIARRLETVDRASG